MKPKTKIDSLGRKRAPENDWGAATKPRPDAPKTGKKIGKPPDYLDDAGKKAWEQIAQILDELGILDGADWFALCGFCVNYQHFVAATRIIKKEGIVVEVTSSQGWTMSKRNPAQAAVNAAWSQCYQLLGQLGLSPSARAKFAGAKNDDDPMEALLGRN